MATRITFERNTITAVAHLTDTDDDGKAFVFCALPGGRPMFAFDPRGPHATTVTNAPACETFEDFKRFVTERFT